MKITIGVLSGIFIFFSALLATPPYTHDAGEINVIVPAAGDFDSIQWPNSGGNIDQLYSASVIVGIDGSLSHTSVAATASGNVFGATNLASARFTEPAISSSEESHIFYESTVSGAHSGNINVEQITYTYGRSFGGIEGLLETELRITNNTSKSADELFGGMYMDFDTGGTSTGTTDAVGYDPRRDMYYQYNPGNGVYIGFGISSGPVHSAHFFRFNSVGPITYAAVSDGKKDTEVDTADADPVFTISQSFPQVGIGQTVKVVVAIAIADSLSELQRLFDYSQINRGGGKAVIGGNVTGLSYGSVTGRPVPSAAALESGTGGGGCLLRHIRNQAIQQRKPKIWSLKIEK